ncbi:ABC transporter permease [Aliihoeflea sp. PC F10.4]
MKSKMGRVLLGLACILIALWLIAPTLVIIPISFADRQSLAFPPAGYSLQWYENIFTSRNWSRSLMTSIQLAGIVAVVATIIGTMAALGLERLGSRASGLLRLIIMTPIIVPGVVLAVGIYAVYLDAHLVGTWTGYVLAHTLLALPFVVIAVGASLSVFDRRLELAAASLGATRLSVFFTVTMPLIMPGILSGMLFAFVTSFDEVIVALFITSPRLTTVPVQIYSAMTRESDPTVAALGTLTFAATTLIIGAGLLIGSSRRRK